MGEQETRIRVDALCQFAISLLMGYGNNILLYHSRNDGSSRCQFRHTVLLNIVSRFVVSVGAHQSRYHRCEFWIWSAAVPSCHNHDVCNWRHFSLKITFISITDKNLVKYGYHILRPQQIDQT